MNVILNAVLLRRPLTGIGNYTWHLAAGLERHREIKRVFYFSRFSFASSQPEAEPGPRWEPLRRQAKRFPFMDRFYNTFRDACFQIQSRKVRAALYHEPNFILMPFSGPSVATIHDLSYLHYPQFHPKERIRRMERGMPRTLKRADHFITDSEYVRKEVVETLGVPANKVTAIPLGVEPVFHPRARQECEEVLRRYHLADSEYLLSVATLEPRKNLCGLVDAYARLPEKIRGRFPLVLVGPKGWLTGALEKRASPLVSQGQIRLLGYARSEDLPFIYAGAAAFAFPSFYEGFGLPVLEAMACGIPALVSDRSSLPEVAGPVGLQLDPENVDDIAQGLERILTDEALRAAARQEGPRRASQFSWDRFVDQTVAVYRQVTTGTATALST